MSTESVLPESTASSTTEALRQIDADRLHSYETFAIALSYPNERFFERFPQCRADARDIVAEYDRLFRASDLWLYGAEYMADNEFQRANILADIMGFYTAFGLEPDKDRPDSLSCEMEFMHYLILKTDHALSSLSGDESAEKAQLCRDAQKKFFAGHLSPAAEQISHKIIEQSGHALYVQVARQLLRFLEQEKDRLGVEAVQAEGQK